MRNSLTAGIVALGWALTIGLAAAAKAVPGPDFWGELAWPHAQTVHLLVVPGAGGMPLAAAELAGGATVDATLRVQLWHLPRDDEGNFLPAETVPNFPRTELSLGSDRLVGCPDGTYPDGDSDADGWVTFSMAPHMGGWLEPATAAGGLSLLISGIELDGLFGNLLPPIVVNSPDINGDREVNLTDVPLFATDYYGSYSFRSDFLWDGVLNLSDVVRLANSLGAGCP